MKRQSLSNESSEVKESNTSTPFECVRTRHSSILRSRSHLCGITRERLSEHQKLLGTSPNVKGLSGSCARARDVIEHCQMRSTPKSNFALRNLKEETRNSVTFRRGFCSLRMPSGGTLRGNCTI